MARTAETEACSSKSSEYGSRKKEVKKKCKKQAKNSTSLPNAPYNLTKKEIEEADKRAKQVLVPAGDSFSPGPIFSRISRMNSHEWKEVNTWLLPITKCTINLRI